jgi:class 3 adenylate cyclase
MVDGGSDGGGLLGDLEELATAALKEAEVATATPDRLQVIAFFDLVGSTARKLARGNPAVASAVYSFNALAKSICGRFGGKVLKSTGDGSLATFLDPMGACRAALNLRHATHELLDWEMTAGLTSGQPVRVSHGGRRLDLLGDVVDRAARIQALAMPGQILMDSALYMQVRADIAAQSHWDVDSQPRKAFAKGIGSLGLYEICLKGDWNLKSHLATPFAVIPNGRPSLDEKLSLVRDAKVEIIEIGIGLTSFAQYFTGQKPEEFRDPLRTLIRSGVNLNCFALDQSYEAGRAWLDEQMDPDYYHNANVARDRLLSESQHHRSQGYLGRLNYYTYKRVPEFWCLGVDVDDPLDGRMFFAPYLMGVARSAMPVVQVSRQSNAQLYDKYMMSVRAVRESSTEPKAWAR